MRVLLCVVIVLESTTYGLISPLLPQLVRDVDLPDSAVGVITGAYTVGMLPACVLLMRLRRSVSDEAVVLAGITSLALGCLVMASVPTLVGVVTARVLMGFGAGLCFGGTTRWLAASAPGREAFYFGLGWGMLSVGTAVGPVVGEVAVSAGSTRIHLILAALFVALLLTLATAADRAPAGASTAQEPVRASLGHLLRSGTFVATLAPLTVPALAIGLLYTLVPLELDDAGHSGAVAVVFFLAAVVGAAAGPLTGHLLRWGSTRAVTGAGLVLAAALLLVFVCVGSQPLLVAVVAVLVLGVVNQMVVVAAGERLRVVGESLGHPGAPSTFVPFMFAIFETVGAVVSGSAAAWSAPSPYIGLAVMAIASYVVTRSWRSA